jgi:uncharacterized delta-60 repeat protein
MNKRFLMMSFTGIILLLSLFGVPGWAAVGDLDTTFNDPDGFALFSYAKGKDQANAVAIQTVDGEDKIVVVGTTFNGLHNDLLVLRYKADGTLDPNFGKDGVVTFSHNTNNSSYNDYFGYAVAIQPSDNKIIVVGKGTKGSKSCVLILRYNTDATGDHEEITYPSITSTTTFSGKFEGRAVALDSSNKIVVVGSGAGKIINTSITPSTITRQSGVLVLRYNSDGKLDTTFNSSDLVPGVVTYDDHALIKDEGRAVALDSLGNIVVVGKGSGYVIDPITNLPTKKSGVLVLRYKSNGTLDDTPDNAFGYKGVAVYDGPAPAKDEGRAVAIQGDKIVVVGKGSGYIDKNNTKKSGVLVLRYKSNGTLDDTPDNAFGYKGVVIHDETPPGIDEGNAVAIQSDQKIVVAGNTFNGFNNDVMVLRYTSAGILDTTFGVGGVVIKEGLDNGKDLGLAVAITTGDSRIVVAGTMFFKDSSLDAVALCYDGNGKIDTTFGIHSDGMAAYDGNAKGKAEGKAVAVQPDGKIVVLGKSTNGSNSDVLLLRYNSNGTLDETFGNNGVVIYSGAAGGSDEGRAVAVKNNKIVVVGSTFNSTTQKDVLILRYNIDGTPDTTFGSNNKGVVTYNGTANGDDSGYAVYVYTSEEIVVAGASFNGTNFDVLVLRYDNTGKLKTSFSTDGVVTYDGAAKGNDYGYGVAVDDSTANIYVVGSTFNGTFSDVLLLRFKSDGTLDTSFSTDGVVTYNGAANNNDQGNAVVLQGDKILVAGKSSNGINDDVLLLRYKNDGTPDATFGNRGNGVVTKNGSYNGKDEGLALALQTVGTGVKIIVAGSSYRADSGNSSTVNTNTDVMVLRYSADGILDTTFGKNGVFGWDNKKVKDVGTAVAVQTDGNIVVAGSSSEGSFTSVLVMRLIGLITP